MKKNTINKLSLAMVAILSTGCGTTVTSDSTITSLSVSTPTSISMPVQKFTVTFDVNGGIGEIANQEIDKGAKAKTPKIPTLLNHEFKGWTLVKNVGPIFDFNTPINENTELFALWLINSQEVNYYLNYLEGTEDVYETVTVSYGGALATLEEPERAHYTFIGWFLTQACEEGTEFDAENYVVKSDTDIFAGWEIKTYEVAFELFHADHYLDTLIVNSGEYVVRPEENPIKPNATFIDWYEDEECTTVFDFENREIIAETTIYAGWDSVFSIMFVGADHQATPIPSETPSTSFTFKAGLGALGTTAETLLMGKIFYFSVIADETAESGYDPVAFEFKVYRKNAEGEFEYLQPSIHQSLLQLRLLAALNKEDKGKFEAAALAYIGLVMSGAGLEEIMAAYQEYQTAFDKLENLFTLGFIDNTLVGLKIDLTKMEEYSFPLHISIAEPGEYRLKIWLETKIKAKDITMGTLDFIVTE